MTRRFVCTCLILAGFCWCLPADATDSFAKVGFESVPPGTEYGSHAGNTLGDVVLVEDDIAMSVEVFLLDAFVSFNRATVGGAYADYFPTTPLELDNISVRFDFNHLGFDVTHVELEYLEFGGADNFAVNDEQLYIVDELTDLPADIAAGVTLTIMDGLHPACLTLDGNVTSFQIGGQELAIDNIIAMPEPTSLLLLALGATALFRRRRRAA